MTEHQRSRRRPSPAPRASTPARSGRAGRDRPAEPEPSLGQVGFDQWFATPVFESDPDERLEEMATSRRGPLRLAASAVLRLDARAARIRHRSDPAVPAPAPAVPAPAPEAPAGWDPVPELEDRPGPGPVAEMDDPTGRGPVAEMDDPTGPDPGVELGDPAGWDNLPELGDQDGWDSLPELEIPAGAPRVTLRRRFNAALDRWADRELAAQARLEQLMLPKRWQS
ncbi:MAG TPA: hypothetical protein VFN68_00320 [Acidimicrobiales bacterium]|nr:hypothetical protein [Acidimicrobiales bacterium]